MTISEFIEKAVAGGWYQFPKEGSTSPRKDYFDVIDGLGHPKTLSIYEMFLDPLAWQAVGKVEGWKEMMPYTVLVDSNLPSDFTPTAMPEWRFNMHGMINALAEGKTIEQYLETL